MLNQIQRLPEFIGSSEDLDLLEQRLCAQSRDDFGCYREMIRPYMVTGWWTDVVARELQQFYVDFKAGKRPKLAMMAPPQHGKSAAVTDFISFVAGNLPDSNIIFGSYSDDLGTRTNLEIQRLMKSERYLDIFGKVKIGQGGWQCNTSLIEFPDYRGTFRNTTVMSGITGFGLQLGVIDDPVKGRVEANSKAIRERTWNWYTDDFFSRFAASAGQIMIMTRWHVDDLLGRILEKSPDGWRVLRWPAVALHDDEYRKKGEALFPEFKPLDFLLERQRLYSKSSWESLYQQTPITIGGGMFPIEKLTTRSYLDKEMISATVRYWDKAGTADGGAYTSGVMMHKMKDGTYVVAHVARGQWAALEREQRIKFWSQNDKANTPTGVPYTVWVEQEPGSGGKESAEATIRMLAGYSVYADKVTGDKVTRADPFAAQVQGGNVTLLAGPWQFDYLDEMEGWPNSKFMDQGDASAGAFSKVTAEGNYRADWGV